MLVRLPRWVWLVVLVLGLTGAIWQIVRWQPQRLLPRQFDTFVERIENNRWRMAGWLVADTYSDRWGFDKKYLVDSGASVFRHFRWIEIERGSAIWEFSEDSASVRVTLTLKGDGTQLATMAKDTASEATEPFTLTWAKTGPMPWQWQITSIDQQQLELRRWRQTY